MIQQATFPLGRIVATRNVLNVVSQADIERAMARHSRKDWGNLEGMDKRANDEALETDQRILSAYKAENGVVFWIVTEWDRSATTILLPSDY